MKVIRKEPKQYDAFKWEGDNFIDYSKFAEKIFFEVGLSVMYDEENNEIVLDYVNDRIIKVKKGDYLIVGIGIITRSISEQEFKQNYEVVR